MQTILTRKNKTNDGIKNALNLALTSASQSSKRAAFGWALLNQYDALLTHDSTMIGLNVGGPSSAINQHSKALHHLILTVEPQEGYCDIRALIRAIEHSSCLEVTIAHKLAESLRDKRWVDWKTRWEGEIHYTEYSYIAEKLAAGIPKILENNRPWVTAVSASTIESQPLPLGSLVNEFGFQAYLNNLAAQNRAILYNKNQFDLLDSLPRYNRGGEEILRFEVESAQSTYNIIEHCAQQHFYSILLLCDSSQASGFAKNNAIDEIYHHIAIVNNQTHTEVEKTEYLKLRDWTIVSSELVGNCTRIHIKNNTNMPKTMPFLNNRLN